LHNWDWQKAVESFDWVWLDQLMAMAQAQNKSVIWSEPSYAWKTLNESVLAQTYLSRWKTNLIPMWANNFSEAEAVLSREHALMVSQKYSTLVGMSHQAWYFRDKGLEPSEQASFDQAKSQGWDFGARYFQFEGAPADFIWDSPYMLGVRDFSDYLKALDRRRP
jgi:hypothetical protein